jgi:uncharacterized membrane protein YsdA (DUF1294 family)
MAEKFAWGYLILTGVMSAITFVAYGIDKRQAIHEGRRISEKRLHQFALLGGWPGAWAGQRVFRHKTQKTSFRVVYYSIVAFHIAMVSLAIAVHQGWILS